MADWNEVGAAKSSNTLEGNDFAGNTFVGNNFEGNTFVAIPQRQLLASGVACWVTDTQSRDSRRATSLPLPAASTCSFYLYLQLPPAVINMATQQAISTRMPTLCSDHSLMRRASAENSTRVPPRSTPSHRATPMQP